jgi:hypothetical protein
LINVNRGCSRKAFAKIPAHAARKNSGTYGYRGTRKGRGSAGWRRRWTMTAATDNARNGHAQIRRDELPDGPMNR